MKSVRDRVLHLIETEGQKRPDLSGQVLVDLAEGEVLVPTRRQLTLEGLLELNATDPERHPIQIRDAKIRPDS